MKQIALLVGLLVFFAGCQSSQEQHEIGKSTATLVEADVFPQHMVGVWQNKSYGWAFMFNSDGRISKMSHTVGRAKLKAEQRSEFPLKEGGIGWIVPGEWVVNYNGRSKELGIEIELNAFNYSLDGKEIKGTSKDIFIGIIPQKDTDTLRLDWISFPKYTVTTADHQYVDYELPTLPHMEEKGELVFEKLDLSDDGDK